ncbi:MAG: Diguanylate kinase, partial [Frankiales bacterium]|nr:Diguanylate kinase [Frankiales bacterium]
VVVAPLHGPDAVLAVLVAEHDGPVPARQVEALELLAAHAGVAVGNARLHEQRRAIEGVLAHQAVHDSLTELANRRLLQDRAADVLAERDGETVAVLLLDLDGFKEINDTFGHSYGDGLLRQVAARLAATVRATDTAARLGGDEFALLVRGLQDRADAERTAARVQQVLQQPFLVDGITLDIEGSIGVALAPDHGHDIDTLLRCADVAMYIAKRDRAGITVYDPGFDQHTPDRLALLGDLRRALDDPAQLQLHYQPKVDVALGGLVGVEALLRWRHPERGMVAPAEFIGTAEGTGLIHPLTRHVLDTALAQGRQWQDEGQWVPIAVNLSARSLLDVSLTGHIADLLLKHQVPAALLRLEITETSIMADPSRALDVLHGLAAQGVRLSIDDFGTGYSSMNYLRLFPVDELKVDRTFVSQICTDSNDTVMVRSMIELGHNLGMHVVAEGVEDQATLSALAELGCDIAQGSFTGPPMPATDLASWVAENLSRRGGAAQPAA